MEDAALIEAINRLTDAVSRMQSRDALEVIGTIGPALSGIALIALR